MMISKYPIRGRVRGLNPQGPCRFPHPMGLA
ncbi:hypothetical protein MTBUT4_180069 [Magnetospirillum sp. UT-4]|nr:hypothetical protein MTBUT4_180069 [Magnetospirillum sp. UT-4]